MSLPRLAYRWLLCAGLLMPVMASAATMETWDLRRNASEWNTEQLIAEQQTPDGLYVRTGADDGFVFRPTQLSEGYEAVHLRLTTRKYMTAYLMWHLRDTPQADIRELPFEVEGKEGMQTVSIPLNYYAGQWDAQKADFVGFRFPENSEVVVQSVSMEAWPWWENALEVLMGFWTYDEFRPYSINFLWGPLLSYNPPMHETLYDTLPPRAHSATQWMYAVLVVLLALFLFLHFRRSYNTSLAFGVLCAVFAGLWLLFDVRMSSEQMMYAIRDWRTFVLQPTGSKTLRTHENIYDVLEQAMPELQKHETYGLLTHDGFFSLVRYMTYPALPLTHEKDTSKVTLWLVAQRPDIRVNDAGMLQDGNGKFLTPAGSIIQRLAPDSFLFSTPR